MAFQVFAEDLGKDMKERQRRRPYCIMTLFSYFNHITENEMLHYYFWSFQDFIFDKFFVRPLAVHTRDFMSEAVKTAKKKKTDCEPPPLHQKIKRGREVPPCGR